MRSRVALLGACLLLSGASDPDPWFGRDKGLHFAATNVISAGGYALAATQTESALHRAVFAIAAGLGAGLAKEGLDLAGYGDPSLRDLAWDVAGTITGTAIALLIDRLFHTPTEGEAAR